VKIEVERAQEWIKKGAQPSNTVKNLLARAGAGAKA
jgi:ribosomal protein S16